MIWGKRGLIFVPEKKYSWSQTHAQVPFAFKTQNKSLRFYYSTRDKNNRSHVSFIETDLFDFKKIINKAEMPVLSPGDMGTFDDCGTMPSWFINHEDKVYMYYTGWNLGGNVSYRLSIGLAISEDDGLTFKKFKNAPILDRSEYDVSWVAQPCVIKEENIWRMWYLSCDHWEMIDNHPEPFYHIKYAFSYNGINWIRQGDICVYYDDFTDAIGRPSVLYDKGIYQLFYSFRSAYGYRTQPNHSYRFGYAESTDGVKFERKDSDFKMEGEVYDWENIMNAYGHVFRIEDKQYIVYNGNGFGKTGFGYAVLI